MPPNSMDKEQIRISKFEIREKNLEGVTDGTPTFSSSNDLLAAESLFLRKIGLKPTDSAKAKSKKIFSRDTEILYQNKNGKDLYYVAYNNRTILAFEGKEGTNRAQELIEKFFSDMAERELGELHEAVTLKNNKDEMVALEIQQFKQELTNLEKGEVKAYVSDTKALYKKLLDSQLKHTNIFRTLNVRETEKERLAYRKLKLVTKSAIQTLNRLQVKADSAINEPRALNSVEKETQWMRNVLLEKLDKATNDVDSFYRFSAQIPNEVLTSRVLFTIDDYKQWFGGSLEQDIYDSKIHGTEVGYNILSPKNKGKNGYNELESQLDLMNIDPAKLALLGYKKVKQTDGSYVIVTTTSNFDKKTCRRCNTKQMTGDFTKDFLNGGVLRAVPEQLIKFAEETMGHDLTKGQKNFLRIGGLLGGGYLLFKALQKGREGLGKIGGDSFLGKIAALAAIEAGMTVFAGQGAIQTILGLAFGGKGAEKIFGWGESLGITDAIGLDKNTDIPIAGTTALLGGTKSSEMHKYVSNKTGKLAWDYEALTRDFPNNIADINNLKNYETTNANYVEDYFRTIGVDPLNPKQPNKTLAEAAVENKSEHAAKLLAVLKEKNLEPTNPETRTLMVSQYDPTLSDWENIQKFKDKGWIKEIDVAYGIEKEKLDDVKSMFNGVQFKDIKGYLGDMKSRDSLDINSLEAVATQKNSKKVNELISKYGSPEMKTLLFDVFKTIGIDQGTPSALSGTQYDGLMVEAVIGLFEVKKQKENQLKTFLAAEALTIKSGHEQDVDNAFTLNSTISTQSERDEALKKLILEHPEYFEFNHKEVAYIKNVETIDPLFMTQLQNAPGLTMKEKTILAAVGTQLKKDYPGFPISYVPAGDGKITMSFTGKSGRKNLDKQPLPDNKMQMTFDVKNLSIDGLMDENLKSVSFANSMPDKGLIGLPLHVFQMGIIKELYEGKSTMEQPFGKQRRGRKERFGRQEGMSFSTASFAQQFKQRSLELQRSDLFPGNDIINIFLEYGSKSLISESANGKVSNVPTSKPYKDAFLKQLNGLKDANGHSVWQIERERKEDEKANATLEAIYTKGLLVIGIEKTSQVATDIKEYMAKQTPEWLQKEGEAFMAVLADAYKGTKELTGTVIYGIGELMKQGVTFALEAGKLVFRIGSAIIEVGSDFGHAIMEDIRSGKIKLSDYTGTAITIAMLAGGGGLTYLLLRGLVRSGAASVVGNAASAVKEIKIGKTGLAALGITGATFLILYLTGTDPREWFKGAEAKEFLDEESFFNEYKKDLGDDYDKLNANLGLKKFEDSMKKVKADGLHVKYEREKTSKSLKISVATDKEFKMDKKERSTTIDFGKKIEFYKSTKNTVSGENELSIDNATLPEKIQTPDDMKKELQILKDYKKAGSLSAIANFEKDFEGAGKKENVLERLMKDLDKLVAANAIKNLKVDTANKSVTYTYTALSTGEQTCTIYLRPSNAKSPDSNKGFSVKEVDGKKISKPIFYEFK